MSAHDRSNVDRRTMLKQGVVVLPALARARGLKPELSPSAPSRTYHMSQSDLQNELVAGNSAFAFDVYAKLRQLSDGNIFFSPYSLSTALAMTYAGAGGETATQMSEALSFTVGQSDLHEAFGALNADLADRGNAPAFPSQGEPARNLSIANAVWGEQTFPFSQSFSAKLERSYGAGLQQTDFINSPEEARAEINDWVAERTKDHIQDIAPAGSITGQTRLALANALYFSGAWSVPFNAEETVVDKFYPPDEGSLFGDSSITVPFMVMSGYFPYARIDDFQLIEFGFQGSFFSFTVIVPDEYLFDSFERALDSDRFFSAVGHASLSLVSVHMPKFEYEARADCKNVLESLGMVDAFDSSRADFKAMVEGSLAEPLFLGDVLHKSFISVDELGAEAAAATIVQPSATGGGPRGPEDTHELHIDRPFIYAIRDTKSGAVLFLGRVMNPAS